MLEMMLNRADRRASRRRRDVHQHMPAIANGLTFNLPGRWDSDAIQTAGTIADVAPSTEIVDADGTYVHFDTGDVTDAALNTERLESAGMLFEGARTNICYPNEDFIDARWPLSSMAVDTTSNTMPNGAAGTSNELRATGANGTVLQDLGVIASAAKNFSIWMKRKTGTGDVDLTLDGGSTWTTKSITSSWVRYNIQQTLADPDAGVRIVTSGDEVLVWGAQVEASDFATSTIPTVSGSVTRSADDLRFGNSSEELLGKDDGTFLCVFTPEFDDDAGSTTYIFDTFFDASNGINLTSHSSNVYRINYANGGGNTADSTTAPVRGVKNILCCTWAKDDAVRIFVDGVEEGSDTAISGSPSSLNASLWLGEQRSGGNTTFANMAHVLIWDRALSAGEVLSVSDQVAGWIAGS